MIFPFWHPTFSGVHRVFCALRQSQFERHYPDHSWQYRCEQKVRNIGASKADFPPVCSCSQTRLKTSYGCDVRTFESWKSVYCRIYRFARSYPPFEISVTISELFCCDVANCGNSNFNK